MLRRFIYLDRTALAEYVTALEDGLVTESTRREMRSRSGSGGASISVVKASGELSQEDEESITLNDTDEARFSRLLTAAETEPEVLGWVEVGDPDTEFAGIGIGAMVSWECDIYVPDIVRTMSSSGEALAALNTMQQIIPSASTLGLDTAGLPSEKEMEAMSNLISGIKINLIAAGEDDDTEWRIAGPLRGDVSVGAIEGRARVVGKVTKEIRLGHWKSFLTFPGMNLLSREQRRHMERQPPQPGKEDEYLAGPALMLDVLAIYR